MSTKKDNKAETQTILDYFAELPDPRRNNGNKRHKLIDILAIAILATICGAEHFTEMEEWGEANEEWLRSFNAPENLALIRKLTHNLLQQEKTLKRGIQTKRLKAGWDRSYLLKILNVKPSDS